MLGLGQLVTRSSYQDFTLTDVSNLSLWLQNGVGLELDGSKWNDSSGNNNHVSQGTEANRAALAGGGLDFEEGESDHYALTSDITIAQRQGFCVAFVVHMESVSNNTLFSKSGNEQIKIVNGTEFFFKADDDTTTSTVFVFEGGTFDTQKAVFLLNRSIGSSNVFSFFKNGVELTPDADFSTNEAPGENPFGFDINILGSLQGSGSFFDGKILEVAFWSKGLSASEIAEVNNYLKSVHGL